MKKLHRVIAAAVVAAGLAVPASAGEVRIEIRDGRVTLHAKDASPREILAEWARVGGTRIVNAERVPGEPLTLSLDGVPEAKALDLVLRSAAGYLAAPRAAAQPGASRFDRVVVLAIARPAAGVPAPPPPERSSQGAFERPARMRPRPNVLLDDQDEPVPQDPEPMPGTAAQPGMPTEPAQGGGATGAMPGSSTSPTPGMPTGAPTAAQPGMPTSPIKPPGQPGGQERP